VAHTPISGPACVYITESDSLATVLPTTFVIAIICAPFALASRIAASVSIVSPD